MMTETLKNLEMIIRQRRTADPESSYVASLTAKGRSKMAETFFFQSYFKFTFNTFRLQKHCCVGTLPINSFERDKFIYENEVLERNLSILRKEVRSTSVNF